MPVAIKNLSSRPIFVPLNSGANIRLSPGEVAEKIPDVELKDNTKVDKLVSQRTIAVAKQERTEEKAASEAEAEEESEKPRTRRRS